MTEVEPCNVPHPIHPDRLCEQPAGHDVHRLPGDAWATNHEAWAAREEQWERGTKVLVQEHNAELAAANARIAELFGRGLDSFPHIHNAELRAENEALQATLDRVTAVLSTPDGKREWHNQGRSGECDVVDVSRVRAALTPEGKP